jgi:hypothetical protein
MAATVDSILRMESAAGNFDDTRRQRYFLLSRSVVAWGVRGDAWIEWGTADITISQTLGQWEQRRTLSTLGRPSTHWIQGSGAGSAVNAVGT